MPNVVEETIGMECSLPMLKPVYEDVHFEVRLPRFVEVPVYKELYENINREVLKSKDINILYSELSNFVEDGVDTYFSPQNGGLVALSDMSKFMEGLQSTFDALPYLLKENDPC